MRRSIARSIAVSSLALVALACACGPEGASDGGDAGVDAATCNTFGCAVDQAPLRTGDGGIQCTPVGADPSPAPGDWPDLSTSPAPIIYVRAAAMGGDGTMTQPLGDLATAIATHPEARTIALARGRYVLAAPLSLATSLTIIGSGPVSATTIVAVDDATGIDVNGTTANVRLAHLGITYAHPAHADAALLVQGQATAVLEQVEIDDAWEGVRVVGSTLHATGLTVRRAGLRGVSLLRDGTVGSTADITGALLRDAAGVALLADRASLTLSRALAMSNATGGIDILGGDATHRSTIDDSAMLCNGSTGVHIENDGATVTGARWTVANTQLIMDQPGGDGIYVGPGATLVLDEPPPGGWPAAMMGSQSLIEGNARTGMLLSQSQHADVYGATIASNVGPGIFVQQMASVGSIGYARIDDNGALGIGLTSGASIVSLVCNLAHGTRMSVLDTDMGSVILGDGLSIADSASGITTAVTDNQFDGNARFGAVFANASATLHDNMGSGNEFGLGSYAATIADDGTNAISGSSMTPATAMLARGILGP